jgi:origin recognition complex subunit 1
MRGLKRRAEAGEVPHFQFVEINGLRLPSPQHAYSSLYEALTGDRLGPAAAAQALEAMFGGGAGAGASGTRRPPGPRRPTVVLVDEMDLLINRGQTVLYNLFEWPSRRNSRLSIIGVANTMDLPERLHQRIGSRLAGRRIVFHPYNRSQLEQIVESRLEGASAFDANAVTLVARKVANCSGDVRRCLELCRRAAEIAQEQQLEAEKKAASPSGGLSPAAMAASTGRVTIRHVDAAIREMFNTSHMCMLREACRLERLVLASMHLEARFTGRTEATLGDIADRLRQLCAANGERQAPFAAVLECAVGLGAKRIIICDPGFKRLRAKVALNVPVNDLVHILANDADIPWLALRLAN